MGLPKVDILLTVKAVLRNFEFSTDLKVNFDKICLFGINEGKPFLERVEESFQGRYPSF